MADEMVDLLEVGDAVAADLLTSLLPLRFDEVADEGERRAGYRLRYDAVVERALAEASRFPDGLEVDEFDDRAVHIVGWDGEVPVATCRLVLPAPGSPLPVEAAFGLTVPGAESMVDWGRVVVAASHRGSDHTMFMGLAARGWLSMRARGFTTALASTPARLVELFAQLGFAVTVLGPPAVHWGEERHPILCEGRAAVPGLARNWGGAATAAAQRPGSSG